MERSTFVLIASLFIMLLCWQWQPLTSVIWSVENEMGKAVLNGLCWAGLEHCVIFFIYHQSLRPLWTPPGLVASADEPQEAQSLQKRVGNRITILCNAPAPLLDKIGVCDQRGAPWYDGILFGAKKQDIAMPSALVIDGSGKIVFVFRSTRVDDRPRSADIIASL